MNYCVVDLEHYNKGKEKKMNYCVVDLEHYNKERRRK